MGKGESTNYLYQKVANFEQYMGQYHSVAGAATCFKPY